MATANSRWRDLADATIQTIMARHPEATREQMQSRLQRGYPFGKPRRNPASLIYTNAVVEALDIRYGYEADRPRIKHDPDQLELGL